MSQPHIRPDSTSPPPTPRWVKVLGIILTGLVLMVIILHLTGNSLGGPEMHSLPLQQNLHQP